jgi:hypothetical protein
MNDYEMTVERRRQRMLDIAERMQSASDAAYSQARRMAEAIPLGQPILIGHHSEKRDRNYRARIWRTQERCSELQKKAEYFRAKASSVGNGGISSDDPDAVRKLREELASLETMQNRMKAVNAAHKKYMKDSASLDNAKLSDADKTRIRNYKPAYSWEPHPFPPFSMSNNNANIRRIKARIVELTAKAAQSDQGDTEHDMGIYRVVEAFSDNRVRVLFDGKPSEQVRAVLKASGFRWSPYSNAWQRMHNKGTVYLLTHEQGYIRKQIAQIVGSAEQQAA